MKKCKVSPLELDFPSNALVLVSLKANFFHLHHVVAVWNNNIFDSSEKRSLPLNRASFDLICGGSGSFKGFLWCSALGDEM